MAKKSTDPHDEVRSFLARSFPSHHEPLHQAWFWNREATPESLTKGLELGTALKKRYPHVLTIRYERGLALAKLGRHDEAIEELEQPKEFPPLDEDSLSLLGRCYKDHFPLNSSAIVIMFNWLDFFDPRPF